MALPKAAVAGSAMRMRSMIFKLMGLALAGVLARDMLAGLSSSSGSAVGRETFVPNGAASSKASSSAAAESLSPSSSALMVPSRRQLLSGAVLGSGLLPASPAFAYETYQDLKDAYEFKYPTGLQKSADQTYNVWFRDIIQPLEGASLIVVDTQRKSISEIGDLKDIGEKLMNDQVPAGAPKEFLGASSRKDKQGREYGIFEWHYQWKFPPAIANQVQRARYQLHEKAVLCIFRRKQYLLKISAEEDRWDERSGKEQLGLVIDSFNLL